VVPVILGASVPGVRASHPPVRDVGRRGMRRSDAWHELWAERLAGFMWLGVGMFIGSALTAIWWAWRES
jgi:hypothetical protein